jgi:hypothetical protein
MLLRMLCRRGPAEADAQTARIAVLLDELDFPGYSEPDDREGHILVEVSSSLPCVPEHSQAGACCWKA